MSQTEIISLIALGIVCLVGIISIIVAVIRGDMKKFIKEKMAEAEKLSMGGQQKLGYVIDAVKEKYKIPELVLNVKKFIESIIEISKQINYKK